MIYFLKTLIWLFLLFITTSSFATVYYVSSSGNDSNSGTSEASPWLSLEKVNNTGFKPGDQILFKRGDSWVGTIQVNSSGTAGSPILYGAYGSGDKPKIYNSKVVSNWQLHSGNIYKTVVAADKIEQLFVDEARVNSARYPNSGYFNISAVSSSTKFSSSQISSSINYSGATAVIRDKEWSISTVAVTGSSGQSLTLGSAPVYGLAANKGFVLVDKLEFLDKAGEWYYDNSNKTLYLWTPQGDSPGNHTVRASVDDYGVYINNKNYIAIRDLGLLHANSDAVYINSSAYITIDNNTIAFPDNTGLTVNTGSSNHISFTNNSINGANHEGVRADGTYHDFSGNTIKNIRLFENFGVGGLGAPMGGRGLSINGGFCTIRYNRIENVGYNGIAFFTAPHTIIEYNYITNACITTQDGGGIYCYNTSEADPGCEYSEIRGNIIDNVPGNIEGCTTSLKQGCGIYMDDRIHHILIENNTVTGSSYYAIYLHNNKNVIVRNNTLFNNGSGYRATGSFGATQNSILNNIILNIVTSCNDAQATLGILNSAESSIVDINNNRYIDKHRPRPFANTKDYSYKSFTEWKSVTGKDNNSTFDGAALASGESEVLFYNSNKQAKTINLGTTLYRDIDGKTVSGSITLQPFTSLILIKTTSGSGSSNQSPVIQGQVFQISSDIPADAFVGLVVASDPDPGQIITYSISGGNQEGLFYIEPTSGKIFAKTSITTSQNKSVELIVNVTDNAISPLSASATITVNIVQTENNKTTDTTPPVISAFSIPASANSLTIPVLSFNASDNTAVTGYLITESATPPLPGDTEWLASAPSSYTLSAEGNFTLYAWVKDAQGNVSNAISASGTIVLTLPSLFSEYLFEETAGTTVIDSKGTNNGNIINQESRCEGVKGKGLILNGTNYVSLGNCFCDVHNKLTLSAWIKPDLNASGYQGIVMHGGPADDTYALYIYPDNKQIAFKTSGTSNPWLPVNADLLWDGNWHNITATYDGNEMIVYLDNVLMGKTNSSGNITSGAGYNLLVGAGRDNNPASLLFKGTIDEVRIYNYALSPDEVANLFNSVVVVEPEPIPEPVYVTEIIDICQGENYLGWTETGEFIRTLTAYSGADSIVTTQLNVNPTYLITENVSINEGENYNGWTQTGQFQRTLSSIMGCDSIIITNLTIKQQYYLDKDLQHLYKSIDFTLYPNPAQIYIYINFMYPPKEKTQILIVDINGIIVYNLLTRSKTTKINIDQLSPGLYSVISVNAEEKIVKKLVVQ